MTEPQATQSGVMRSVCEACGEPVSCTDGGGCVGTLPGAYHMQAECLLAAVRREHAEAERLRAELAACSVRVELTAGEIAGLRWSVRWLRNGLAGFMNVGPTRRAVDKLYVALGGEDA